MKEIPIIYKDLAKRLYQNIGYDNNLKLEEIEKIIHFYRIPNKFFNNIIRDMVDLNLIKKVNQFNFKLNLDIINLKTICQICNKEIKGDIKITAKGLNQYHKDCYLKEMENGNLH